MDENVAKLKDWIAESDNIVFFGGAGVSTESGIPDFRSVDGLYNQKWAYPPETILSHSFFERDPEEYYRFHHDEAGSGRRKAEQGAPAPCGTGAGGQAQGGHHAEYRRAASGGGQQKRAGAARQHPARLLLPLPQALSRL